jgi:peptide chain release factor 2
LGGLFETDKKRDLLVKLQKESREKGFWDDTKKAKKTMKKIQEIESLLKEWEEFKENIEYLSELESLGESTELIEKEGRKIRNKLEDFELKVVLSDENDSKDAVLSIHPGAGGTESCDWASMLFRMYTRWIENRGYKYKVVDYQKGDEAGLKDVTVEVMGEYAYGYLKAERGIHRLVRISPFDSGARRHTSFASVFVYPLVEDDIDIELKSEDIEFETFKASGPGGQHVNKSNTAVRLIHKPTNIVVTSQSERSQMQNRMIAERILKSKLYQMRLEELEKEKQKMEKSKKDIEWGHQIRSYILHPYQKVKDHRTDTEIGDAKKVLDGHIDVFIRDYLRSEAGKNE